MVLALFKERVIQGWQEPIRAHFPSKPKAPFLPSLTSIQPAGPNQSPGHVIT